MRFNARAIDLQKSCTRPPPSLRLLRFEHEVPTRVAAWHGRNQREALMKARGAYPCCSRVLICTTGFTGHQLDRGTGYHLDRGTGFHLDNRGTQGTNSTETPVREAQVPTPRGALIEALIGEQVQAHARARTHTNAQS